MARDLLPNGIDAEYLSNLLRLPGVQVRNVVVESSRLTVLSNIVRLRLEYDGKAEGAPGSMVLKTGLPDGRGNAWNSGRQEVAFYSRIAPTLAPGLVPRCFDAAWDADTLAWHVLLEDLEASHFITTAWPLPPPRAECEVILDTLARFHAAWWDDPRLGVTVGTKHDAGTTDQYLRDLTTEIDQFTDRLGDRVPEERIELYRRFLDAAPRLFTRYMSHRDVTIIHGDAHVWNTFIPRNETDGVRLFDWDAWRVSIGSNDLAYMMAMHWYPDRRRLFEKPLLDRYHATLLAHGVRGYDRAALDDDYRLSVLMLIARPVWQSAFGIPNVIWWNNFERIMMAVDDLGCRDLLA
jgi:hypothetical protein